MLKVKQIVPTLLSLGLMAPLSYADGPKTRVALSAPGFALTKQTRLIKPVEADKKIRFVAWLTLRNKDKLNQLVQEMYESNSPNYQHFLTHEEFEAQFAPTKEVEQTIQQYFIDQGMRAQIINHSIRVTATAKQIEQVFNVQLNYYQHGSQEIFANSAKPSLNVNIAKYILQISGLNSAIRFHSNYSEQEISSARPAQELHFLWDSFLPYALPTDKSVHGFSGKHLQKTYKLDSIPPINGKVINGEGQTLVIVERCTKESAQQILKDANQYFEANGITKFYPSGPLKNFAIIQPNGQPYTSCKSSAPTTTGEVDLDIQSSHTIAPGDNTVLVIANEMSGDNQYTALMDVIASLIANKFTIAGFSNAYVISNSWSERESSATDPDTAMEQSLQTAAANGISVNFSSGDCGDNTYTSTTKNDTGNGKCHSDISDPRVDYPASSIYVTAVGGTSIFVDERYNYSFENAWGTYRDEGYDGGTTGGVSQLYGPVSWQSSISNFVAGGYGIINNYLPCPGCRALPDISMLGDPSTGLHIVRNGTTHQAGGTSLACPLFSGALILVNQARALLNKGSIGQAAPYLYTSNNTLLSAGAIKLIVPPTQIISGAKHPPPEAPSTAFRLDDKDKKSIVWGWDSSLTIAPENQFWNDAVGVGSPYLPNFVGTMANM